MFIINLFYFSLQINKLFPINDVQHIVNSRSKQPKWINFENLDINKPLQYRLTVSTKLPTHAILSLKSKKLHMFLHNGDKICRCIWDGNVSFNDKRKIVKNMVKWVKNTQYKKYMIKNIQNVEYIKDIEDQIIFIDVFNELKQQ